MGLWVIDPTYIAFMTYHFEDQKTMDTLYNTFNECSLGQWLVGDDIRKDIDLPTPVIKAVFEIFESKGYEMVSQTLGSCEYVGQA